MKWLTIPMVLVLAVIALGQDVATYDGDGFSFDYPAAWVEVVIDDVYEGSVAVSPDPDAAVENGVPTALVVQVTVVDDFVDAMNIDDEVSFTVEGDADAEVYTGFAGGVFYVVDAFTAGFSGVDVAPVVTVVAGDPLLFIIEGGVSDYLLAMVESDDGFVYILTQAPAGTLDDWRGDVEALIASMEIE
jgi:hypothetical protein